MANNPEDWLTFLLKLEKNSEPLNDALLNKLIGRYSQAIEALPPDKYGQNESFARIQVRFAELKAWVLLNNYIAKIDNKNMSVTCVKISVFWPNMFYYD